MIDGKLGAAYSWHDLRHAFAQRNVGRGLVWLRDRARAFQRQRDGTLPSERAARGHWEDVVSAGPRTGSYRSYLHRTALRAHIGRKEFAAFRFERFQFNEELLIWQRIALEIVLELGLNGYRIKSACSTFHLHSPPSAFG